MFSEVVLSVGDAGDPTAYLWDARTAASQHTYKHASVAKPNGLAIVRDLTTHLPRLFLLLSTDKTLIHVYHFVKDAPVLKFTAPERLSCIAVSENGVYCAAGSDTGKLYLWEIHSGNLMHYVEAHFRTVHAVTFAARDQAVITVSDDSNAIAYRTADLVRLEYTESPQPLATWTDHLIGVTHVVASPGSSLAQAWVYTVSLDRSVRIRQLATGEVLAQILFPDALSCLALAPDGVSGIYVGSATRHCVYRVEFAQKSGAPSNIGWDAIGGPGRVHTVGLEAEDANALPEQAYVHGKGGAVNAIALNSDGTLLVSAGTTSMTTAGSTAASSASAAATTGVVVVWDVVSRAAVRVFSTHKSSVTNMLLFLRPTHWPDQEPSGSVAGMKTLCAGIRAFKRSRVTLDEMHNPQLRLRYAHEDNAELWDGALQIACQASVSLVNATAMPAEPAAVNEELEQLREDLNKLRRHHQRVRQSTDRLYQLRVSELVQARRDKAAQEMEEGSKNMDDSDDDDDEKDATSMNEMKEADEE